MSKNPIFDELFYDVLAPLGVDMEDEAMGKLKEAITKLLSDGYVRKELYKEKLTEITGLKESLTTAMEGLSTAGNETNGYKERLEAAERDFDAYKRNQADAGLAARKADAALQRLKADGADPRFLNILMKELDMDAAELSENSDGAVCIANWETLAAPLKASLPEVFGVIRVSGAKAATPPANEPCRLNPWAKDTLSLEGQTAIYRENPGLARELAAMAGVTL